MNLKATIPPSWNPGNPEAFKQWYKSLVPRSTAQKPIINLYLNQCESYCFVHNKSYKNFIFNLLKTLNS